MMTTISRILREPNVWDKVTLHKKPKFWQVSRLLSIYSEFLYFISYAKTTFSVVNCWLESSPIQSIQIAF